MRPTDHASRVRVLVGRSPMRAHARIVGGVLLRLDLAAAGPRDRCRPARR